MSLSISTRCGGISIVALALLSIIAADHPANAKPRSSAEDSEEAEPVGPFVGGIAWRGVESLANHQLREVMFTKPPNWRPWRAEPEFSEPTLLGDMERIEGLYQLHGYYEATATYSLVWNREETRVAITIEIDEGPPVLLETLDIVLAESVEMDPALRAALSRKLPLSVGDHFSPDRYARSKEQILERMAEAGYPMARITGGATVDIERHAADVSWQIVSGARVLFGAVSIQGLYMVDESTVRREIRIEPGQRYSTKALIRIRRGLQRQGLYAWASVRSVPGEKPAEAQPGDEARSVTWPIEVTVTERSPYAIDAGIGYSTDESFRATASWRNNNFFGDARQLRIQGVYSGVLAKGQLEFTQPYFFDPRLSLLIRSSVRRETEPVYAANRLINSVGLSRPIFGRWRGRITYEHSYNDVTKTSGDANVILDEPQGITKLGTMEFGVRRETVDDLLDPKRGTWLDFVIAPTLDGLGADFDFITYVIEARAFLPVVFESIDWPTVIAGRVRIGAIQPIRSTNPPQVPVVSRFFSGGANSHRGFRYHTMPPTGTTNDSVGGVSSLVSSVEWRFPIWRKLGGVVFVDAALLDLQPFRYPLDQLYWAVGPGFRYNTIVGPLRLDFGVLLNPPENDPGRFQWFISVGQSF